MSLEEYTTVKMSPEEYRADKMSLEEHKTVNLSNNLIFTQPISPAHSGKHSSSRHCCSTRVFLCFSKYIKGLFCNSNRPPCSYETWLLPKRLRMRRITYDLNSSKFHISLRSFFMNLITLYVLTIPYRWHLCLIYVLIMNLLLYYLRASSWFTKTSLTLHTATSLFPSLKTK